MEVFNITPKGKGGRVKKIVPDKEVELLEFNMTQGDSLEFKELATEPYFKVNIYFKHHTISRTLCLN